ncbi:hypothetical protein D3C77_659130 [compost metagenome]
MTLLALRGLAVINCSLEMLSMQLIARYERGSTDAIAGAEITKPCASQSCSSPFAKKARSSGALAASFAITRNTLGAACSGADHRRFVMCAGVPAA